MIKVFSYRPEYFNNNGDQGNLEALAHFTKSEISMCGIEEAEFVLFGDASRAAMREFEPELEALVKTLDARLKAGKPTLLVGSCYEFFASRIEGIPSLKLGDRVSEFRGATSSGITVKGYRNSEVVSQDLFISGHFVATTLFGPVLAKNPRATRAHCQGFGAFSSLQRCRSQLDSKALRLLLV
jgi:hypothetical protein